MNYKMYNNSNRVAKMMKSILICMSIIFAGNSFGQQVIGSFPGMDGGLEGQTATTTLGSTRSTTNWTVSTTAAPTRAIISNPANARTGNKYAAFALTSTNTRLQTPTGTGLAASTQYTVQYYYKATGDPTSPTAALSGGIYLNGTTGGVNTNVTTTFASGVWTKATATLTSGAILVADHFANVRLVTGFTEVINIDDFVVYAGTEDVTVPDDPTAAVVNGATSASLNVSWTAPGSGVDGGGYIVVRGTVDPTTAPNANGIYALGSSIGTGSVVYVGTGTNFTDNGLSPTTTYYYRIYAVDKAFNYSAALTGSGTTTVLVLDPEPTVQTTNLTFSAVTNTTMTLNWTPGNGASRIVLARAGSAVDANPVDGNGYTANTIFGSGAQIGTGNYVVYSGSGNSVSITGLAAATNYHFAIYEYNGTAGSQNYLTTLPLTNSQFTTAATISSAQNGNWNQTSTWVGGVIPSLSDNVLIVAPHIVVVEGSGKPCNNLTIDNGAKLWTNVGLTTNRYIRIYGTSFINNGEFGADADGLCIEGYSSNTTITISGTGVTKLNRYRPATGVVNAAVVFDTDVLFTYTGSTGTGGAGLYSSNSGNNGISFTVNTGKTLTFNPFCNFSTSSSVNSDGTASQTVLINGTVNMGVGCVMSTRTSAGNGSTLTVNGTLNIDDLNTGGAQIPVISVGPSGSIIVNGTAEFANPLVNVIGAGTYTQASGNLQTGNADGIAATGSTGSIRTNTRTFSSSAGYSYVGTTAQTTGSGLPATIQNLTVNNAANVSLTNPVTLAGDLNLTAGSLVIGSNLLTVVNAVNGAGTLAGSATSNLTLNGTAGTINFASGSRNINELSIGAAGAVTLGTTLTIFGTVGFTAGGSLDMNAQTVTLKSTATNTARIADLTGSTLSGATNVTVERWIPLRGNSATGGRAYRLLTSTVNTPGSINANWMEGGMVTTVGGTSNPVANYGTHITGADGNTNGFDVTASNQSSLYNTANAVVPTYTAVANTTGTMNGLTGYFLYIRGDRSVSTQVPLGTNMPTTATTLRTTGTVIQGTQTAFTNPYVGGGALNLVTNPYPSPIDWSLVRPAATNITNFYTLWDPNVGTRGGFVTVDLAGVPTGGGTANQFIQPGQAFFVQSDGGVPTVSIQEVHKSAGNNNTVFIVPPAPVEAFRVNLFFVEDSGYRRQADGVRVLYDNVYSAAVDAQDAREITNWDENIAVNRENTKLAVEGRPVITVRDTIPLFMNNMKQKTYEFEFIPTLFTNIGLKAELIDNFLNSRTTLSVVDTVSVNFTVTADPGSYATDRFTVVFGPQTPLAIDVTTIRAQVKYQPAAQGGNGVQVDWTAKTEQDMNRYELERSFNGSSFTKIATIAAIGNSTIAVNYGWLDASPQYGANFYRIKAIDNAGLVKYTTIVKVNFGKANPDITIYPNPVNGNSFNLQLTDLEKGSYQLVLFNSAGQAVYKSQVQHNGGSVNIPVTPGISLPTGMYQLRVTGANDILITKPIIKN